MTAVNQTEVTTLLERIRAGDAPSADRLMRLVQDELHRMAAGLMHAERPDHTLQPTALVNEAVVRLLDGDALRETPNRRYLFAAAARTMRQILVDHARQREAAKRGGERQRVPLDQVLDYFEEKNLNVLALHEALDELATLSPRQSEVVTLRFFGGFTVEEVADQLGVSVSTVESDFRVARSWLRQYLREEP